MNELLVQLEEDPNAVAEVKCEFPTGNVMYATIGPKMGAKVAAQARFELNPTEDEIKMAQLILNKIMEADHAVSIVATGREEIERSQAMMRRFLGGGRG